MTIRIGAAEVFASFGGGRAISIGRCGPVTFQLQPGELIIPADTMKNYYSTLVSASGCFTGSFMSEPVPVPDADGWEPRRRYDR